jgi:hypothetical protein
MWKCVGIDSGTPFTDVSLDEGEWVDYDEKVSDYIPGTYHSDPKY